MSSTNFVSLKDGTIINLNAIAWIDVDSLPQLPEPKQRTIVLTFPAAWGDVEGTYNRLELALEGADAEEFIAKLEQRGVNVEYLRRNSGRSRSG